MKGKKAISTLLAGMLIITGAIGNTASVFAKSSTNFKISNNNYEEKDLIQYVNPLIGTNNFKGTSEWAGTAPLVTTPFGMTNFTPQTRLNAIGDISYMYRDNKFSGFFATHQPAIWMGDYGYVNVMPQIGNIKPDKNGRALTFSHNDEVSTPYYYKVTAGKNEGKKITSEMTATERCAVYRFTYPNTNEAKIFVESARDRGNGHIEIDMEKGEISGWNNDNMSSHLNNKPPKNLKGYFVIQFTKPVNEKGTYENYNLTENDLSANGQNSGAYLSFNTSQDEVVEVRIGTSFISVDQARTNIRQEIGNKTFDEIKDNTRKIWNDRLNVIQIDGATEDENYIFYTAMYHALTYPRTFYETVNGEDMYFSPYDDQYHKGKSYTDFSLWDTFRAQNSLITLVAPDKVDEMVNSLLQTYQEGGYMPKWPNPGYTNIMIGTHADSIVAEAVNKGFDGFDYDLAYEAVLKDAMVPQEGDGTKYKWGDRNKNVPYEARGGLSAYKVLGYIPNRYVNENVSRTIEFAYDDWCVAQVAKAVGKNKEANYFLNRSMNYKNAISPDTGYAMGRDVDGNWTEDGAGYTEGDSRKYTWFAPQDPQGLLDYMTEHKGENFYNVELEKAFGGQGGEKWIEHQNEPCHNYAYMFDFSGRPDLTQKYARQTLLESYTRDTNGELGNDDCGQMSAWYVFSAMGFYPVNPASGEYMIGSPIFDKVTINNPKTNTQFVMTADNNHDTIKSGVLGNCYIQSAQLNGKSLDIPVLTYSQITSGGTAHFVMGNRASKWAKDYEKAAIQYSDDAESPKDDSKPPLLGNSEVTRVTSKNLAKDAKVSATDYADPKGDIDIPSKSLIDGNYDVGYASKDIHSNADLANSPYYLTMEWDNPQSKVSSFKMWSNFKGSQNPTKMDLEIKDLSGDWSIIKENWVPEWQDGDKRRCSATIKFEEALKDITGLRIRIKEANFEWKKIAVRELEVFEDYSQKIELSNPSDYVGNIKYRGNKLEKVLFNGKELKENTDYELSGDNKTQIKVFGKTLIVDGADSGAKLEFVFSQGKSCVETLVIWDNWKANLESQIKKAEMADNSTYIYSSLEKLPAVLEEAKEVLKDENSTEKEYETASIKLQKALDSLVEIDKSVEVYDGSLMNIPGIVANVNGQVKEQEGAYQAFDFNTETKWCCVQKDADKDGNFWLEVKMPKKYVVDGMGLLSAGKENKNYITKNFSLQVKVDGEWQDILKVTNNVDDSYRGKLPKKVVGDEFRLLTPSTADVPTTRVLEFHLYGKELRTELDRTIKEAEALDSSQYTKDSWAKLTTALENAKAVLADGNATEEEVYGALKSLQDAMSALIFVVDKTELGKAIKEAEALDSSQYTKESWSKLAIALKNAKAVLADGDATEEVVTSALKSLQDAMSTLIFVGDKTELGKAIKEVESLDSSQYTKESWSKLTTALENAKTVFADENATEKVVNSALKSLQDAKSALIFVGDKTELGKAIKEVESLDSSEYTKESWSKLAIALKNAKAVLADGNATEEVVSKVLTELKNAHGELVLLGDKTNLNKAIKEVESLDKSIYTKDSWNTLEKALTKAKEVVANKDATQDVVDQAVKDLQVARQGLVNKAAQKEVQSLVDQLKAINAKNYTTESYSKVSSLLKSIDVEKEISQKDFIQMKDNVDEAILGLVDITQLNKKLDQKFDASLYTTESYQFLADLLDEAKKLKVNGTEAEIIIMIDKIDAAIKGLIKVPGIIPTDPVNPSQPGDSNRPENPTTPNRPTTPGGTSQTGQRPANGGTSNTTDDVVENETPTSEDETIITENQTPQGGVKEESSSNMAMIAVAAVVVAFGAIWLVIAKKKKAEE